MATTQLASLAYGAISFPWGKWISRDYSTAYAQAIETIYKRANYNASKLNSLPFKEDYTIDAVAAVIDAYGQGVLEKKIKPYDDKGSTSSKQEVYDYLVKTTGYKEDFVRVVMYEAYWAAYGKPQQISPDLIIDPNKLKDTKGGPLDQALDTLTLLKWIAIIGVGAYALSQINIARASFGAKK